MAFGNELTACGNGLIELEFIIDDIDSLRNGVDTGFEGNVVVEEHGFVEADILRLDHDVRGREEHANEVGDEGVDDIAIHHTALEAFLTGESLVGMQGIHITAT
jgi:predicted aspartyl protease